ncbi:MAG: hypothetical protein J7L44_03695 [Candidatus Diapherotrites archaeon]|nr:hypothetical protein [Candidatus Diapherotrites archaeon]
MALESFVRAVRASNTRQAVSKSKAIPYKKPEPKFIDADELAEEMRKKQKQNGDWKTCKFVKQQNGEFFCTYFIAKCAKEKCNKKYINEE